MTETDRIYTTPDKPRCAWPEGQLSPEFHQLRCLAAELHQVSEDRAALDDSRNPLSAIAGDMLIADLSRRVDALGRRIHSKPVTCLADLVSRAALVLFWSDNGLSPEAWEDPEAALIGEAGSTRFASPADNAGTQLAAAVFNLAQQGGVHG